MYAWGAVRGGGAAQEKRGRDGMGASAGRGGAASGDYRTPRSRGREREEKTGLGRRGRLCGRGGLMEEEGGRGRGEDGGATRGVTDRTTCCECRTRPAARFATVCPPIDSTCSCPTPLQRAGLSCRQRRRRHAARAVGPAHTRRKKKSCLVHLVPTSSLPPAAHTGANTHTHTHHTLAS